MPAIWIIRRTILTRFVLIGRFSTLMILMLLLRKWHALQSLAGMYQHPNRTGHHFA